MTLEISSSVVRQVYEAMQGILEEIAGPEGCVEAGHLYAAIEYARDAIDPMPADFLGLLCALAEADIITWEEGAEVLDYHLAPTQGVDEPVTDVATI